MATEVPAWELEALDVRSNDFSRCSRVTAEAVTRTIGDEVPAWGLEAEHPKGRDVS